MSFSDIPTWMKSADWEITDPGDANSIANDLWGLVPLESAQAETRTLASPAKHGLFLILNMMTDAGDIVVTVANPGYDEIGNTTLTFANTGEYAFLISMRSATGTYAWRLISHEGVTGPEPTFDDVTLTDLTATTVTTTGLSALQNITGSGTLVVSGANTTAGITDSATSALATVTVSATLGVTGATTTAGITDSATAALATVTASGTLDVTGATTVAAVTASGLGTFNAGAGIEGDLTILDGGTATQMTSTTTGVTLNTHSGQITTVASTLAGGAEETFTVTNSKVAALDTVSVMVQDGTNTQATAVAHARQAAAGSFDIIMTNLHASTALNGTLVINFNVISGASS